MKLKTAILILFVFMLLYSCDLIREQTNVAQIKCKATFTNDKFTEDSTFFTEAEIEYFDTTTNELMLNKVYTHQEIIHFNNFVFYLGADSLFKARLAADHMSSIINDLVIYQSAEKGNLFIEDGYPMWIDNLGVTTLRAQNKDKRAANWKKFIERLAETGKIKKQ